MLEQHAIAIPHCEAIHAKSSAIYLLRPTNKVHFQQADDDNDVAVSLVIALIVENPQQQLKTFTLFIWQVTTARYRRDTNHSS
ncbi:galactitol-specific PTS system EIIA component [Escherichia coli]|nr:galactitol-specific PTS system EIIA component [Escherichia coli]